MKKFQFLHYITSWHHWYYAFCGGIKNLSVTAGIKSYKSVSKKKKEKHDKIGLLGKIEVTIEVLISKSLMTNLFQ